MVSPRPKKKRVKVFLHSGETIINQIAYAAVRDSTSLAELKEFLAKTDRCKNVDELLRLILSKYEVEVVDE